MFSHQRILRASFWVPHCELSPQGVKRKLETTTLHVEILIWLNNSAAETEPLGEGKRFAEIKASAYYPPIAVASVKYAY